MSVSLVSGPSSKPVSRYQANPVCARSQKNIPIVGAVNLQASPCSPQSKYTRAFRLAVGERGGPLVIALVWQHDGDSEVPIQPFAPVRASKPNSPGR